MFYLSISPYRASWTTAPGSAFVLGDELSDSQPLIHACLSVWICLRPHIMYTDRSIHQPHGTGMRESSGDITKCRVGVHVNLGYFPADASFLRWTA